MRLQRIVAGVDFSESSLAAARWVAGHLAPSAELVLVHSVFVPQPPRFLRGRFPPPSRVVDAARIGAEARLVELARGSERVHVEVRAGAPAEQLVRCAEDVQADLIVVGKHGERPGAWDWFGSTAEQVLLQSAVPVLLAARMRDARPRRLLVAVDEGDVAASVLHHARALSEQLDARVVALHVLRSVSAASALGLAGVGSIGAGIAIQPELHDAHLQWEVERRRERLLEAGFDPERTRSEVAIGEPQYEIVRAAQHFGSDLIVMGKSRGLGGIAHTLLGSVVRAVLRRAQCPVLVVQKPLSAHAADSSLGAGSGNPLRNRR